jgi:glyoxylase-like metal-dependent hydrolase (beta-lactamase superfamily II)
LKPGANMRATSRIVLLALAVLIARSGTGAQDYSAWFIVTTVGDGVRRIEERGAVNLYLIEGRDRALLVDTGTGLTKLRPFIQTLTGRPLTVVLTHAHPDHSGAYAQFPAVSVLDAEVDAMALFSTPERRDFLKYMVGAPVPPDLAADRSTTSSARIDRATPGQVFDLGGHRIEVIAAPGHTAGSLCLLDRDRRLLFAGDTSNELVWLHPPDAQPMRTYLRTLETLDARAQEFDTVLPGHGHPVDRTFIGEQVACARAILDGTAERTPYASPFGEAMVATYRRASIAFNPQKLSQAKAP